VTNLAASARRARALGAAAWAAPLLEETAWAPRGIAWGCRQKWRWRLVQVKVCPPGLKNLVGRAHSQRLPERRGRSVC